MLKEVLGKKLQELELEDLDFEELDETMACGFGGAKVCSGSGTCGTSPDIITGP